MNFGSSRPPAAPDPMETARAQMGLNKEAIQESAKHNQINQFNPFGSVTWTGEIGSPERTQHVKLDPQLQRLLDYNINNQNTIAGNLRPLVIDALRNSRMTGLEGLGAIRPPPRGSKFYTTGDPLQLGRQTSYQGGNYQPSNDGGHSINWRPEFHKRTAERFGYSARDLNNPVSYIPLNQRGDPNLRRGLNSLANPNSFGSEVNEASDSVFNRGLNRLQPLIEAQRDSLNRDLTQRGIPISSEGSLKARGNLERGISDQLENLALTSDAAGRAEHERLSNLAARTRGQLFNENLSDEQFKEAQRQAGFSELLSKEQFQEQQRSRAYDEELGRAQFHEGQQRSLHGENIAENRLNLDLQRLIAEQANKNADRNQQDRQFGANLNQQDRQFGANFGEQQLLNRFNTGLAGQNQHFQQGLQRADFDNRVDQQNYANQMAFRQRQFEEAMHRLNRPLQMYQTLSGQSAAPGLPQFTNFQQYNMQAPNYMDMVSRNHQAAMNAWGQQQQARGNMLGSLGSLGGTILQSSGGLGGVMGFLSDERMKENIVKIGTFEGHNLYEFNYKGDETKHKGVIAQEIEETKPDAITEINGLKYVNYDAVVLGEAA